ncbi:MAG: nucleotidyltransferase domain-containing protein [Salinivirgaceae bacterium]|nr:nucleotidyltransferase domain-containing protein [Salinivirgaceae bacterium]
MFMSNENILNSIRDLGTKVLPKDARLILFGSQARGDVHTESDWDLLILLNDKSLPKDRFGTFAYPFVELGWNYGAYFSPKVYTNSEWQQRRGTPFYENVNKEGIVLC